MRCRVLLLGQSLLLLLVFYLLCHGLLDQALQDRPLGLVTKSQAQVQEQKMLEEERESLGAGSVGKEAGREVVVVRRSRNKSQLDYATL